MRLGDYIRNCQSKEFIYGEWDCAFFAAEWLGDRGEQIISWLREKGYFEQVRDEVSYYRFLLLQGMRSPEDMAVPICEQMGMEVVAIPEQGEVVIDRRRAFGIADYNGTGFFLRRDRGVGRGSLAGAIGLRWVQSPAS